MNWRAIRAIVRKDLAVALASKPIVLPLVIVPVVLLVILPLLAGLVPTLVDVPGMDDAAELLERMPPALAEGLAGYTPEQQVLVLLLAYLFAPMFLLVPMMVANVLAADSFAGEKERKTLEALLHSPVSDRDMVAAKLLAPWLAALAVTMGGFVAYAVVVNAAAWPTMGRLFFPNPMWGALTLWLAPAVAALGLGAGVIVSAKVRTVQEAYQLGGVVVLPLVMLIVGQATGVLFFGTGLVLLLGLVFWLAALTVLAYGVRTFRRSELVTRL